MWKALRCRLVGKHDYQLRREPRALLLECQHCGHRTHGWNLEAEPGENLGARPSELRSPELRTPEPRAAVGDFRLFIAESTGRGAAAHAIARTRSSTRPMNEDGLRLTFGYDEVIAMPVRPPMDAGSRTAIVIDSPAG